MNQEQEGVLESQDSATLAEWWCELNRWGWPEDLPGSATEEERKDGDNAGWQVMQWIFNKVGNMVISKAWNKDMPDDVFEDFYASTYGNDTSCGELYKQWGEEQIKTLQKTQE
jgi:hypothetical protein